MAIRSSAIEQGVLSVVLVLSLPGQEFSALAAVHDQAADSPVPAAAGTPAGRELFDKHCVKCHGADGSGSPARGLMPDIPNFTERSWQRQRSDARLLASILDGKGQDMPSFSRKITKEQTRDLVAHVRALAPGPDKAGAEKQEEDISASAFDEKFRRLQEEMAELKKQFRQAAKVPRDRKTSKPSKSLGSADPSESSKRQPRAAPRISAPAPSATPTGQELFRQHCVKCHGADGTGRNTRRRQLNIPDFTDAAWQARRSDAQLLTSILGGKGKEMPRWRGKISTEQARSLTAYVRTLPQVGTRRGRSHRRSPLRPKLLDRLNRQEACPRNSSGGLGNSTQRSCTSPSRC